MGAAERIKDMMGSASFIRRMFEAGNQLKEEYGADQVYDFSLGNPDILPPREFTEILTEESGKREIRLHGYMPNAGYPYVREKAALRVSREQETGLDSRGIIMTAGAGGALNVILKSILNPGDTVLGIKPCFMEYRFYADNHGGKLQLVPSQSDFDLDLGALEKALDPGPEGKRKGKIAALIINSPNNPTGRIYPEKTLRGLAGLLEKKSREHGRPIYLISDEPYRRISYGTPVPPLFPLYRNTFIATSYSKELSIPGERIGYLALHPEAEDREEIIDAAVLCNRILGYVNAPALMQRVTARMEASVDIDIYRHRRELLCGELGEMGYSFHPPDGTFYLFPEAPGGDDMAFVEQLREKRILAVPGSGFAAPGYFRLSFCVEDTVIRRALPGFREAIGAYRG